MPTTTNQIYDGKGNLVATEIINVPQEVVNADTLRTRADQSIAGLVQIKNSTGTLTGVQLSSAVRLLATVLVAILRLQIGRLDDTDG